VADVGVELVPEPGTAKRAALDRALAALDAEAPSAWWRSGIVDAHDRAPAESPRPSAYEAARSPRSTLGATRA
jgi:hypothetical protein